ncbi:MAG: long-chain fatty acid--CoA ligase [Nevskia sp.]|nr:long-chain fatty acid--CoA ligase [Nevskia sp.]
MNIAMILDMAAEAFGDRVAVVSGDSRYTYAELRVAAQCAAIAVRDSGARYLALLDVNSPAAPVAIFAAAYAGVSYVPLNYRLTRAEINELVDRIAPALLIVNADTRALVDPRADVQLIDRADFLSMPATDTVAPEPAEDPRAVAVQLFTSGTTGKPKAAILRHENLMSYIVGTVEFAAAEEDDAILVTVPPYHIAGISSVLSSTYACRRMVQLENFEAKAWLEACARENVSNAFIVPTMLSRIVEHLGTRGAAELPTLRALAYGGGKMPQSTIERAMQLFPQVDFTNAYGLTETSSTIAVLGPDDHRVAAASGDPAIRRRLASVGKPTAAVEIEVRDEEGRVLGPEEAGLVFVRGGQVSGEYLALGSQLDADGWFPTRDRGYTDAEGFLFLDGRADDVIVRGGENISPGEIEDVLLSHPAVADAAVVAMPDEQWGEVAAAAIVLKAGASVTVAELQERVKQQLRSSRVPQAIVFRDALPYNELGKVLRRVIRQEFVQAASALSA